MKLSGSVALVTGGASGLGAATVRRLVAGGAKALIVDRDEARGQALAAEIRGTFAKADVTDPAAGGAGRRGRVGGAEGVGGGGRGGGFGGPPPETNRKPARHRRVSDGHRRQ